MNNIQNESLEKMICPQCGFVGQKERFSRGNYLLEIFLWVALFVPGALYTTWRAFNEFHACPICKNEAMTPSDSELGKKISSEKERMREPISRKDLLAFMSKLLKK